MKRIHSYYMIPAVSFFYFFIIAAGHNVITSSCNLPSSNDSLLNADFQKCIDSNYIQIEKFVDLSDSLDYQRGDSINTLIRIDTLIHGVTELLIQLADSGTVRESLKKDSGMTAVRFLNDNKNPLKSIAVSEAERTLLDRHINECDARKISFQKDTARLAVLLREKTEAFKVLKKKDKGYDSLQKIFVLDTAGINAQTRSILSMLSHVTDSCKLYGSKKEAALNTAASRKAEMLPQLRRFKSSFSFDAETDKNKFSKMLGFSDSFYFYNDRILSIKQNITSLEQRKRGQQVKYDSAASKITRCVESGTEPVTQIRFYFREAKRRFTVCIINLDSNDIRIHNNGSKSVKTLRSQWQELGKKGRNPVLLMNAGMYNQDYGPTGLMVTEDAGKRLVFPLNEASGSGNFFLKPNGVFLVDNKNKCYVMQSSDLKSNDKLFAKGKYDNIKYATQSGPMLVINGKIHRSFSKKSENIKVRNGVGVSSRFPNKLFVAISDEDVSFYDMASLFRDVFKCENALYLDGVVSRLYYNDPKSKKNNPPDNTQPLGPVLSVWKKSK